MRHILLFSVLLLGVSWMAAQTSTGTGQSSGYGQTSNQAAAGTQKTVTGCLSQANGKYMLTDSKGMSYELMGDSAKLADHVGHEIKVTGTENAPSGTASGSSMGDNAGSVPSLEVISFKHISKTCKMGGAMTH